MVCYLYYCYYHSRETVYNQNTPKEFAYKISVFITESFCLAGIKSRAISDSQMTASSFHSSNWAPSKARLDGIRGWAPQSGRQGNNKTHSDDTKQTIQLTKK